MKALLLMTLVIIMLMGLTKLRYTYLETGSWEGVALSIEAFIDRQRVGLEEYQRKEMNKYMEEQARKQEKRRKFEKEFIKE